MAWFLLKYTFVLRRKHFVRVQTSLGCKKAHCFWGQEGRLKKALALIFLDHWLLWKCTKNYGLVHQQNTHVIVCLQVQVVHKAAVAIPNQGPCTADLLSTTNSCLEPSFNPQSHLHMLLTSHPMEVEDALPHMRSSGTINSLIIQRMKSNSNSSCKKLAAMCGFPNSLSSSFFISKLKR